jgi:protein-disulfide isomerase
MLQIRKGSNVFTSALEMLNVRHTSGFSDRYFNEHPHKYNLFGISQMLSDYGVENVGTRIASKQQDLFDIELPFIAHSGGDFVVVSKIDKDKVQYIWNGKSMSVPVASFLQSWTGVVLLAESSPDSIEPNYREHRKRELLDWSQKGLLLGAVGLILLFAYVQARLFQDLGINLLLAVNLIGVYIGYLLVLKQLNIHSKYADKICSLFNQRDCNNVLESEAAKLWGVFGWSEIGLGYFVANVLMIAFLPHLICFMAVINIVILPYSFWSIWYQKIKAKQWCPLCLIVQVLLWGIFVLDLVFGYVRVPELDRVDMGNLLITSCIYSILMLSINLLTPKLSAGNRMEQLQQEINSIKADENVFKTLLQQQPYYEVNKTDSQILFGNPNAKLVITILTNPFCNPCSKMHRRVEQFLRDTKGKICMQYVFSSFSPDLDFANKYLIAARFEEDESAFLQIIGDWFEKGKALKEDFFKELQLEIDNPAIEDEFDKHEAWKVKTQLRATPTILVNGYRLPGNYKLEDLRYFANLEIDVNQSLSKQ